MRRILNPTIRGITRRAALGAILASVAGLASPRATAQDADLQWKLTAGEQLKFTISQRTTLDTEADLARQTIELESDVAGRWRVAEIDARGTAAIEMTIDTARLHVTLPTPSGARKLDVQLPRADADARKLSPQEEDTAANLRPLIGAVIAFQFSPRGEISDVRFSDELKEAVRAAPQAMQLRPWLSEEGIRELLGQGAALLPEKPVAIAESWSYENDFRNPAGDFRRRVELTYRGPESIAGETLDRIDVTASLSPAQRPEDRSTGGLEITAQQTSGELQFNREAGFLRSSEVRNQLTTESPFREKKLVVKLASELRLQFDREQ